MPRLRRKVASTMKKFLLSAALLAALVSPASAWRSLDRGGRIGDYKDAIAAERGVHQIKGDCMSACTMWLGYKRSCVVTTGEDSAVLWFHSASDPLTTMRTDNPWKAMSPWGNHALLDAYPPRVAQYVFPFLQSPDSTPVSAAQLVALGVTACR